MLRHKEFFDKAAEHWDETVHHGPKKLKLFFNRISLKPGFRVLDVGTGTGVLIPYIYDEIGQNGKIKAIDLSSKMLEKAKQKYPYSNVEYIEGDVIELPLKDGYFDCILCYSVFPHFVDQPKTVSHLSRKLNTDGKLVIAHSQSRYAINHLHKDMEEEVNKDLLPPVENIADMMKKNGLKIREKIDNDDMFLIIGQK